MRRRSVIADLSTLTWWLLITAEGDLEKVERQLSFSWAGDGGPRQKEEAPAWVGFDVGRYSG